MIYQKSVYTDILPDSTSFNIIIEHSVPMVPNDILRRLTNNLPHNTFELYSASTFVKLFFNWFVALINDLYLRNWNKIKTYFYFLEK